MLRRLVSAARLHILRLRSRWGNVTKHAGLGSGLRLHHLHKKQRSNMARTKEFTFKQDFTRTLVKHHPWLKASHPPPPSGKATSRDFKHEPCRSSPQRRPTAKPRISTGGAEMEPALNRADKGKLALDSGHNHHRPASGLTLTPSLFVVPCARTVFVTSHWGTPVCAAACASEVSAIAPSPLPQSLPHVPLPPLAPPRS